MINRRFYRYDTPVGVSYPPGINQPYLRRPSADWYLVVCDTRPYITTCRSWEEARDVAIKRGVSCLEIIRVDTSHRWVMPRFRPLQAPWQARYTARCHACAKPISVGMLITNAVDTLAAQGHREGYIHGDPADCPSAYMVGEMPT